MPAYRPPQVTVADQRISLPPILLMRGNGGENDNALTRRRRLPVRPEGEALHVTEHLLDKSPEDSRFIPLLVEHRFVYPTGHARLGSP